MDAHSFLPPYDQRQYEMVPISLDSFDVIIDTVLVFKQLKSWERALEQLQLSQTSTGTKKKFAFKRKDRSEKPPPSAPEIEVSIPPETTNISPTLHLSLTSKSGCLLTRASLPDASSIPIDSELIITNLNNCIVDLMYSKTPAMNPTAVHIRNVTNCVLLLPAISGSILLETLQRCVVTISGCHQVRRDPLFNLSLPSRRPPPNFTGPSPQPLSFSLECTHQGELMCTFQPRPS